MTDTLQRALEAPVGESDDYLDCGCCTRPPTTAADKVAELEARREAVERRLRGMSRTT